MRKEVTFVWLDKHIRLFNEASEPLDIDKGLQQSIDKLRNMSDTRVVVYFGDCLAN